MTESVKVQLFETSSTRHSKKILMLKGMDDDDDPFAEEAVFVKKRPV